MQPALSPALTEMMPFSAPSMLQDPDSETSLVLANATKVETSATVELYTTSGRQVAADVFAIGPEARTLYQNRGFTPERTK